MSGLLGRLTPADLRAHWDEFSEEEQARLSALIDLDILERDPLPWLQRFFPQYVTSEMAWFHEEMWDWFWSVQPGIRPEALLAILFRGGAKSTTAELGISSWGMRGIRKYVLYVCNTQEQADDHVGNVASLFETKAIEEFYPLAADRALTKYGNVKAWRRSRLRCANGFTIDALGLDTAARGVKLEEQRPDAIVIDDVDDEEDSLKAVQKKIRSISRKLIPAGTKDLAIVAVQNLVHQNSVFSQILDGRAELLTRRKTVGPVPAIDELVWEARGGRVILTGGTPVWEGFDLQRAQEMLDDIGITSFLSECQHDVEPPPGGMFDGIEFRHCRLEEVPQLVRVAVWCDPAVTDTDQSDSQGVHCDGIDSNGTIYRLFSWEQRSSPTKAIEIAIRVALQYGSQTVGVETDQGGDTWESVYWRVAKTEFPDQELPRFVSDKAGSSGMSKAHRAQQMLDDYIAQNFVHVIGTHEILERALRRFPRTKPFDLVDASWYSFKDLKPPKPKRGGARASR